MSDYETTQKRRNVIVGVFVIIALGAIFWMIFIFGDLPLFVSQWKSYKVVVQFPSAPGVEESTPVRFCGYQVGRVTNVKPPKVMKNLKTGKHSHQAIVVLSIDKKYIEIPDDIEVKLMSRGLGSSYVELKEQPYDINNPPKGYLLSRTEPLQGSTGMTSEFFPEESQKKLEEIVDAFGQLINNANDIVGDPNSKESVKKTLANMAEATAQATKTLKEFEQTAVTGTSALKNVDAEIEKVINAIVASSEEFNKTLEEFQQFSTTGRQTMKSVDAKAETLVVALVDASEQLSKTFSEFRLILEKVNNGDGSAAKLINDGRFYESLLENSNQMKILLDTIAEFSEKVNKKGSLPIKLK